MLARLSASAGLKTRQDDDFSISLADAWASVSDVLTFYQERIANESYVRTATRASLAARACASDRLRTQVRSRSDRLSWRSPWKPRPEHRPRRQRRSPSTSAPGCRAFRDRARSRRRSRPSRRSPRTWNGMPSGRALHERHPIPLPDDPDRLYLQGTATNLQPGDSLLITPDDGSKPVQFQRIAEVVPDPARQRTSVRRERDPGRAGGAAAVQHLDPHHPSGATRAAIHARHAADEHS